MGRVQPVRSVWFLVLTVFVGATFLLEDARGEGGSSLALKGIAVIPHVGAPEVRFRRGPIAPLDARVQLFIDNQ